MEFISSAFGTASLTWAIYYLLSFFGFEYVADFALIPVAFWTVVAFGSLPVAGLVWVVRHVRITVV